MSREIIRINKNNIRIIKKLYGYIVLYIRIIVYQVSKFVITLRTSSVVHVRSGEFIDVLINKFIASGICVFCISQYLEYKVFKV